MITTLREQLMDVLPEFGCHLGYDGKAIARQMRSLVLPVPATGYPRSPPRPVRPLARRLWARLPTGRGC